MILNMAFQRHFTTLKIFFIYHNWWSSIDVAPKCNSITRLQKRP